MRKKKSIIIILFLAVFCLTGCVNKKALSTTEVTKIVEGKGYKVTDGKASYAGYQHILEALNMGNSNFRIQFIVVSDEEKAKLLFENNKEILDGFRKGSYKNFSLSGKNFESYELISDGYYMYVSRVDNTLLYVDEKEEYKNDIKSIIKALNY